MIAYRITCLANGKVYIGITKLTAEQRFAAHRSKAQQDHPTDKGRRLLAALRKYPRDQWMVETIATADAWDELCAIERRLIIDHKSMNRATGYNATSGGEGAPGRKQTPEEIEKRAAKLRGRKHPQHAKDAVSRAMKGKPKSPEHIAKSVAARRGLHKTPEQIEKSAVFHRGRKRSDETRRRLAENATVWWERYARGEVSRKPNPRIRPQRDADVAEAYYYEKSYERAGARFGIGGPAAHAATKRAIGRLIENLETVSPLYEGIKITAPVHPDWLDMAV